jgi:hypothetical protein
MILGVGGLKPALQQRIVARGWWAEARPTGACVPGLWAFEAAAEQAIAVGQADLDGG